MQIDSLKYFYDVAILKSISKVANKSHISQPALSQQLLKLEEKLGVKLLDRSNKGVELTKEGKILFKYSDEILTSYNHLIDEFKFKDEKIEIKIQSTTSVASFIIANMMTKIINIFNKNKINFKNESSFNSHVNLLHNVSDIIIGANKIEDQEIISEFLGKDNLIIVSKLKLTGQQLNNTKLILLDDKRISLESYPEEIKGKEIVFKSNCIDTIKNYLMNSSTIAILPKLAVVNELSENKLYKLDSEKYISEYELYINYKKDIDKNTKKDIKILRDELVKKIQYKNECI